MPTMIISKESSSGGILLHCTEDTLEFQLVFDDAGREDLRRVELRLTRCVAQCFAFASQLF